MSDPNWHPEDVQWLSNVLDILQGHGMLPDGVQFEQDGDRVWLEYGLGEDDE